MSRKIDWCMPQSTTSYNKSDKLSNINSTSYFIGTINSEDKLPKSGNKIGDEYVVMKRFVWTVNGWKNVS